MFPKGLKCMQHLIYMGFTLDQDLAIASICLAFLLFLSEVLSWLKCDANSITQLLFIRCKPQPTIPV